VLDVVLHTKMEGTPNGKDNFLETYLSKNRLDVVCTATADKKL